MRSIVLLFCLVSVLLLCFCSSPVEQKLIQTMTGNQQLYYDKFEKSNIAWAPDSSKLAFQTPVALVTMLKYSLSGEFLDTLITLNVPYIDEDMAPVYLSPDGERVVYQSTEKKFNVITLATRQAKSYRFPELNFVLPLRWSDDGEKLYGTTEQDGVYSLTIVDRHTSDVTAIVLDSLSHTVYDAQLYESNAVLYSGTTSTHQPGIWYKDMNGVVTKIASAGTSRMTYFPEQEVVVYFYHDSDLGTNVFKKYSMTDFSTTVLNEDFVSLWSMSPLGSEDKIVFGCTHAEQRLGIYTLTLDGDLQQISDWWPFEETQWIDNGQALVAQKLVDDDYNAIHVYDLFEERLTTLSDAARPMKNLTPAFTPNSQNVIFSQNGQLVSVPALGGDIQALTPSNEPPQYNPELSPNGLFVVCDDGADIYVVPVAGGEPRKISENIDISLTNPTWAPDAHQIACQAHNSLEILNFDGQQLSEAKSFAGTFEQIQWARAETPPFGAPILYRKGQWGIAIINPENGSIIDTFSYSLAFSFCWAANGRDMIYSTPWLVLHTHLLSSLSQ